MVRLNKQEGNMHKLETETSKVEKIMKILEAKNNAKAESIERLIQDIDVMKQISTNIRILESENQKWKHTKATNEFFRKNMNKILTNKEIKQVLKMNPDLLENIGKET